MTSDKDMDSQKAYILSHELQRYANKILGKEEIVKIRRTAINLSNEYLSLFSELQGNGYELHISGSFGEGFRFQTSDLDFMCIVKHIKIFTSRKSARENFSDNTTKLLMKTNDSPPGFVKLELVSKSRDLLVKSSLTRHASYLYLSSAKWKRRMPRLNKEGKLHGPCQNGILGRREIDLAYCLKNDNWPFPSHGFIKRLHTIGWPSKSVLKTIVSQGCHLVAVGCKDSSFEDIEWRLSFSFTEELLIREMNHCQFLCYGLLKIFLKETIETQKHLKNLLCSYFMKTIVFWEITNRSLKWDSSFLIERFWSCIGRLINYVHSGYCPNFFIPENNMFAGKIKGRAQEDLLSYLISMYNEGFPCLLRIPSLAKEMPICLNNQLRNEDVLMDESTCTKSEMEISIIDEFVSISGMIFVIPEQTLCIHILSILSENNCHRTDLKMVFVKLLTNYILQHYIGHGVCASTSADTKSNRDIMKRCIRVSAALKKLSINSVHKDMLTALCLFRIGFYKLVIKYIQRAIFKMQSPHALFVWNLNEENYRSSGGENTSLSSMINKLAAPLLFVNALSLPELRTEIEDVKTNSAYKILTIPPMVLGHFLLYLCYRYEGEVCKAQEVLEEIKLILLMQHPYELPICYKSISYILLGICQELAGDYNGARESYYRSNVSDQQTNILRDAPKKRTQNMERNKRTMMIY